MASGFFLGGVSEGINQQLENARKDALLELQNKSLGLQKDRLGLDTQVAGQNYELGKTRNDITAKGLDLQAQGQRFSQQRQLLQDADMQVANTMKIVADTVAQARAAGNDPQQIFKTVSPLVDNAANIYGSVNKLFPGSGRSASSLYAQVNAMLTQPSAVERATVEGKATAAKQAESGPLQVVGEDANGNKIYGWPNPATREIILPKNPIPTALPGRLPTNGATDNSGIPVEARADVMHGDEFLRTLTPERAATVKAIAEGRMPIPPRGVTDTKWKTLADDAARYDPEFDLTKWATRVQARKEFNSGSNSPANAITAGNTAIQHLKQLSDAAEALENGGWTGVNWLKNEIRTKSGSPLVTNFNNIRNKYVDEAVKFYRGSSGNEADIKRDIENLSVNGSPEQLRQAIAVNAHLMASKIQALQERWKNAMGPSAKEFPILSTTSSDMLKIIEDRAGTNGTGTNLPAPPAGFSLVQ